jgi:hypothetical protein
MTGSSVARAARLGGLLALVCAVVLFGAACSDEGRAKLKAAASSIASGGLTPTQLPAPTPTRSFGRPSEAPTETAAPIPSESSEPAESPEPSESAEPSPSETETTEAPPTTEPSPTLSFSPSPVESPPTPSPTLTESPVAAKSGSSTAWIWIVLAVVLVGGIVGWALWARSRGQRAAAWRSRARDPFSEGVVLHDRVRDDLGAPEIPDDRLDESLTKIDRIGQQLNALTVDAPDEGSQRALAGLLMSLGAVRSALEEIRRAPDQSTRQAAIEPARGRATEFERSLGAFRAALWPQSTPDA